MKKTNRKLALHRETVRTLGLREVAGGVGTIITQATSYAPYRCVPTQGTNCATQYCTSQ
ncbi:MAG TPA: hypothetical protein VIE43_11295 [Thermoanaerobaculia bacterium]|jgi:hypothetical protein|nr:hypothetical protein [Thermoanaerobaculia bacterium]